MTAYIVRRLLFAIPILLGVNVITFALFFLVNTPDDMARMQLGAKRVTPEAIQNWKHERGYDKPLLYNAQAPGASKLTDTIFYEKSLRMFVFDFGRADDGRDIAREIRLRMGPSLAVAVPSFVIGLLVYIARVLASIVLAADYPVPDRGEIGDHLVHRHHVAQVDVDIVQEDLVRELAALAHALARHDHVKAVGRVPAGRIDAVAQIGRAHV